MTQFSRNSRPLVLIGSGGHAREVAEIALQAQQMERNGPFLGFLDSDPSKHGLNVLGFPVLGGMEWLNERAHEVGVLIAVGDAAVRRRIADELGSTIAYSTVVSPLAHLSEYCQIGEGTVIFPQVVVSTQVNIGRHVQLNSACSISHDSEIGDFCSIYPGARTTGGVKLGEGVTLGTNSCVVPYKTVGPGTQIGAGACVIDDLPGGITAVGVPAKPVTRRD